MSFSFPQFRDFFFTINYSNKFSDPPTPSPPSGAPIMWMLVCLMLSQYSFKLSSLFHSFLFVLLILWVLLSCLWIFWIFLLLHLICCWTPLVYFQVFGSYLVLFFPIYLFKFSLCSFSEFGEHIHDLFGILSRVYHLSPFY